jgi:fatty acid amide hydrolase
VSESADPCDWSASQITRRIAAREISALQVCEAYLARIAEVNPRIHAVAVPLYEQALAAARDADVRQARGESLGPLHGVPVTVKECFHVARTPATLGLLHRKDELQPEDGILVRRLRNAGAILLGKTNVPQLMLWHECDNPLYGRTNNPWDLSRTPGGSTGGEAALIAARGSALGLGNDLGGSIRAPAHFCGIYGLKPTSGRLPRGGVAGTFQGMEALLSAPGPLARSAEDLALFMRVASTGESDSPNDPPLRPMPDPAKVKVEGLRIGWWAEDGVFTASPAVQRAVREAADALAARGAQVKPFCPDGLEEFFNIYLALLGADAGEHGRRLAQGEPLDWRLKKLLRLARLPSYLREPLVFSLRRTGQQQFARLISYARPTSASGYWQLTQRLRELQRGFWKQAAEAGIDVFLSPPHGLPAMPHRKPIDLVPAASYAFLMNCLDAPAGIVPVTRVLPEEENSRPESRDRVLRQARATDRGSAGLPVGVQISAAPWREDLVLAAMQALEEAFRHRADYPLNARVPAILT